MQKLGTFVYVGEKEKYPVLSSGAFEDFPAFRLYCPTLFCTTSCGVSLLCQQMI
jgi:hypothetical protein